MRSFKIQIQFSVILLLCHFLIGQPLVAQTEVVNAIEYKQISSFETDYSIIAMKISGDGSKIVFATGGPAVQVYTINTDGSGLTLIYDFERNGTGPFIDINETGEKVIWCDGYGEIFIANSDGSVREELATLLPNPDPDFEDLEPEIFLPPRITADGTRVYFIHMGRDPRASGVWYVNSDDSGLTQVFNYLKMASDLFGRDGTEYNYNTAFTDGFDISGNGSKVILGTRIFKLEEGDLIRGDAVVADGTEFYDAGEYAHGTQPFATNPNGDSFIMYRIEFNQELGYDEINVYFVPIGTGDPIKVISGLDQFGSSAYTQMTADGTRAITVANNGRLPITLVNSISRSRLDLVSIDGLSNAIGSNKFSNSWMPSITWNGDKFCFLSAGTPPQIWVARIKSDGITSQPSITEVKFDPYYILPNAATASTIEAHVTDLYHPIQTVTFDGLKDGVFMFRAIESDFPSGFLVDDGSFGDAYADDGYYSNNTVRSYLAETPLGDYTIRIAAANSTLKEITAVDVDSISIREQGTSIKDAKNSALSYNLYQNYPNPFHHTTRITYEIPIDSNIEIKLYDVLGNLIAKPIHQNQIAGQYSFDVAADELPGGIYFYTLRTNNYTMTRKMHVLD